MKFSLTQKLLAVVLSTTIFLTGCNPAWIKIALADLPVLIQIATQILNLTHGGQASPSDVAALQKVSNEATADLQLLQAVYEDYKAHPNATNRQRILDAGNEIITNLPALLSAVYIQNKDLRDKVSATVSLVVGTVDSIVALIPQPNRIARADIAGPPPTPEQLKFRFNTNICKYEACEVQ